MTNTRPRIRRGARRRYRKKRNAWVVLLVFEMIVFLLGAMFGCSICTTADEVFAKSAEETVQIIPMAVQETPQEAEEPEEVESPVTETPVDEEPQEAEAPEDTIYDLPIQYGQRELDNDLWRTMVDQCRTYDVPLALALALAEQESGFNPDAVSMTNDHGLMQINEINFKWLRDNGIEPLSYEGNIEAGILMLSKAINAHSDYHHALMAYNCGDAGAKKLWDQGIHTSNYSRSIMERFHKWDAYIGGK